MDIISSYIISNTQVLVVFKSGNCMLYRHHYVSLIKKKYHILRQCLFQIFDSGWILINDNHTLAPVKNPLITPSTDYIDDFVDDISGMFNIYEIIISIHALQFTQLRPILMMTVY